MSEFQQGHALVIGVGADLENTVIDAKGMADILRNPELCAYPHNQVTVLTENQATRDGILQALEQLASQVDSDSTVVLYFSGHGYVVTSGIGKQYFLMPYGYDDSDLVNTAIDGKEFMEKLKAINAQKLLVLLDCCYAGGLDNEGFEKKAPNTKLVKAPLPANTVKILGQGKGRVIISSCREGEVSYTGAPYSQFTQALVEAFAGAGASSEDGYVRVADMATYAAKTVPQYTKDRQNPVLQFGEADNFAVAYYAGGETKAKGLPAHAQRNPTVEPANADEANKPAITVTQTGSGAVAVGDKARAVGEGGVMADTIHGDVITGANARKIQAGTYVENQNVEKQSVFDQSGQKVYGAQSNIAGNVTVGGDFVGRDKITHGDTIHGDKVRGDKVGGDKNTIGDIIGNTGVAIGRNSRINVNAGLSGSEIAQLLTPILEIAKAAPEEVRGVAVAKAQELQVAVATDSQGNDSKIAGLLEDLTKLIPGALSAVVSAFASPVLAGVTGPVTKYILAKLRVA